jgi:DNA (cytosine-5)-methyltransferase 1
MEMTTTSNTSAALTYLAAARRHHSQSQVAKALGVDPRTIRRWERRLTEPPAFVVYALQRLLPLQLPLTDGSAFDFIDLFAGIGGLRLAFQEIGGQCVFSSEWDAYAQKTYAANFPDGHPIHGDVTKIDVDDIPSHDVLLAGFPCQPFSIAGVSKKNALGKSHGFLDETQGTLFFDVARIIDAKRPRAFLLENVKNLVSHDNGNTFRVILRTLRDELGYHVHYRLIDAAHFVPQHRERVLILGFRDPVNFDWQVLDLPDRQSKLRDILHRTDGAEPALEWDEGRYFDSAKQAVDPKYTLTNHLWRYLQGYAQKHREKGNGFGFGLVTGDSIARTLSARYYKDGSEILVKQSRRNPRRLTPRECARLMGFPDSFRIPVSDTRAYKQFGNSVVVPVIREVARIMRPFICETLEGQPELPMLVT